MAKQNPDKDCLKNFTAPLNNQEKFKLFKKFSKIYLDIFLNS